MTDEPPPPWSDFAAPAPKRPAPSRLQRFVDALLRRKLVLLAVVSACVLWQIWPEDASQPGFPPNFTVFVAERWGYGPEQIPVPQGLATDYGHAKAAVPVLFGKNGRDVASMRLPTGGWRAVPMLVDPWEHDRFGPGDAVLVNQGFSVGRVRPVRTSKDYPYRCYLWLRWKLFHWG